MRKRRNSIAENTEMMKFWDNELNTKNPNTVLQCSNLKMNWKCELGHRWVSPPSSVFSGHYCPYCSNQKVLIGFNDLSTTHPHLAELFSRDSKLRPEDVTHGSNKFIICVCENGHEYKTTPNSLTQGRRCGVCTGKQIIIGVNDLTTTYPELCKEWSSKNKFGPETVTAGSNKKVIWEDEFGHEWISIVLNRINGRSCPKCSCSKMEKITYSLLDAKSAEYIFQHKFSDCKDQALLVFDFYLPKYNCCIECQGIQHYEDEFVKKFNQTTYYSEKLSNIRRKYNIKREYCVKNGIKLIEIKYTEINNIEEILKREIGI